MCKKRKAMGLNPIRDQRSYGLKGMAVVFLGLVFLLAIGATGHADCVGFWDFEEPEGNICYDTSGYGNDATISGGPFERVLISAGNHALHLFEDTEPIEVPNSESLMLTGPITITAWVYFSEDMYDDVDVINKDSRYRLSVSGWMGENCVQARVILEDGTTINIENPSESMELDRWYHVAMTYDTSTGQLRSYQNGEIVEELTEESMIGVPIEQTDDDITALSDRCFNGYLDKVSIYNVAFSPEEIKAIMVGRVVVKVSNEQPENGEERVDPTTDLCFQAPKDALCMDVNADPNLKGPFKYDVYFGTDPCVPLMTQLASEYTPASCNDVMCFDPCAGELNPVTEYFWRVDINDLNEPGDPCFYEGPFFGFITWGFAYDPVPPDGEENVDTGTIELNWIGDGYVYPSADGNSYDVYFGDSYDEVEAATVPQSQQDANSYAPVPPHEPLELDREYCWRVDEVNSVSGAIKGHVWCFTVSGPRELLYNGILLPEEWPPDYTVTYDPMPVPYLDDPPAVIPIDVGRQLFVDDFLIQDTNLTRTYHLPEYHPTNPVLTWDEEWEEEGSGPTACVFSDGVWYDPVDELFKMWYMGGLFANTCYAYSCDGINWTKPELDVRAGTNIVLEQQRDSSTVWLDLMENDPERRYKMFTASDVSGWRLLLRCSPDGIHWSDPVAESLSIGDRSTVFYNPFRNVWVDSIRADLVGKRARKYREHADVTAPWQSDEIFEWVGADYLDPHNPNPEYNDIDPQLYNLDATAYESLMLGLFSIHQGPPNEECDRLGIQKRNEVLLGFSRDGFYWYRPDRRPFLEVNEVPDAWNWGNVQSAGGGCLVVGDNLYFYFSGRALAGDDFWDSHASTGLAILRRDGFASMDAGGTEGELTTRPVLFSGKHLFVNVDSNEGELLVDVLDINENPITPFTSENCVPISVDKTLQIVSWDGIDDLSTLVGQPVRFRFHLKDGRLYSFWVSPSRAGVSNGYVAAGGPGFPDNRDVEPYCGQPGQQYYDSDINQDCYVNLFDFAEFAENWVGSIGDWLDLAELAEDWLECTDPFYPDCCDLVLP